MNKEKLEKENAELKEKILLERCSNCEKTYHEYGKGCAWRSLGNEYCFDGMNNAEANAEITRNFNHFQTCKKQKEYDDQHREEINRKACARYRAKCGIKAIKEME